MTNLRAEHEEAKIRYEAAVGRLRDEARMAGEAKEAAEGRAREANAKVSQLETEIKQVRSKAEEEVRAAQGKIAGAEQKVEHAEGLAAGRLRELEDLRSKTAAEAEKLRVEALSAAKEKGIAEAKVEQLEKDAEVSRQRITTIEAELNAANAHVEALQAPASQHEAAEARAQRLSGELASEKQKLIAAEAKAEASASKVASLESDLAAQRATNSQDALRHQTESELHENKAVAAEERANAAEERASAAEAKAEAERSRAEAAELRKQEAETRANDAEIEARRVKAAADQASGVSGEVLRQRDRRIQGLEGDLNAANAEIIEKDRAATAYETSIKSKIAGLEEKARKSEQSAQEAEARAQAAESRAAEAEKSVKDLEEQVLQIAHSLSAAKDGETAAKTQVAKLLEQKWELEKKIGNLEQTIGGLEQQILEKVAERSKVEGEATAAQTRIGELEKKIQEHEAEITRLQGEIQNVWTQGQSAGKESIDQKGEIDRMKDEIEVLTEDLRVAKDAQRTVDLLAESERKLTAQVRALTRERNDAQRKVGELEQELAQHPGVDPEIALAADNLRSAGVSEGYFQRTDPRVDQVAVWVQESAIFRDATGKALGEAKVAVGGAEGRSTIKFTDGSRVSTRTSRGVRKAGNQDGNYIARFTLPDGREVKVLAGADGAGGHQGGDVASSAFIQGVHARIHEAASQGKLPTAVELFEHGERALGKQKEYLPQPTEEQLEKGDYAPPTGAASVVVIVGDEATVASKGDSNVLWARAGHDGEFEVLGVTEADARMGYPPVQRKYNNLVRGLGYESKPELGKPHHYRIQGIKPGDRLLVASDGFYGALVGPELVEQTSSDLRSVFRFPEISQEIFVTVDQGLKLSAGKEEAADAWHDLAVTHMRQPAGEKTFFGMKLNIPPRDTKDNVFIIDYEQGSVTPNSRSIIPKGYEDLIKVPSLAESRQRADLVDDATNPKIPSPVPPPLPSSRSNKTAIQNQFSGKYVDALVSVYGTVFEGGSVRLSGPGNEAARQFVELYLRFPEL
ncbi:MAG TPA: hypothetical protein VJP40_00975, partial [bacterium]|nr:hypothetical protein [bacterium]